MSGAACKVVINDDFSQELGNLQNKVRLFERIVYAAVADGLEGDANFEVIVQDAIDSDKEMIEKIRRWSRKYGERSLEIAAMMKDKSSLFS